MLVSYQAERPESVQGAIIRYETRLSHGAEGARFLALDKTPILPDAHPAFEPSWAANRVLALVHASLADLACGDPRLREVLSAAVAPMQVRADVVEGSVHYQALLNSSAPNMAAGRSFLLDLEDVAEATVPRMRRIAYLEVGSGTAP
ncbi:hypothetical protein [Salipiger abyssi]|uniref:hypothetical protein n=1 Tax=Salipiger abyssi TaxID=1250539 RepID=UPI004058A833